MKRAPRAATAWSWDISRPLSEQLAETAADDAAADAMGPGDQPLSVTIDSDGNPAAQINGLCEAPPLLTPDDAESLADDLMLGADAARQAARDGHHHPAVVVELLAGSEPEQGVEFEIEPDGAS